jgi:hypothetical protein
MKRLAAVHWLTLPFVVWAIVNIALGHGRWEHQVVLGGVPLLAFGNARTKRLLLGIAPMGFLGMIYDTMRWFKDVGVTPERVHLCDLRGIDMHILSVMVGGERGTVHDWVQAHPSMPLDLLFAIPYGTFLFITIGFAVFLYVKDYARMRLFAWGFLLVNLAGFVTYHLYPAAAPWYFHAHGCTVDMAAQANEGANLARVDAFLGIHYFHDMYGRSSDVFGAMPSLHVSYPLLILLFGWPVMRWLGRVLALLFLVMMCSAAAYLDHHWITDIILGLAYTTAVYAAVMVVARSRSGATERAAPITTELAP